MIVASMLVIEDRSLHSVVKDVIFGPADVTIRMKGVLNKGDSTTCDFFLRHNYNSKEGAGTRRRGAPMRSNCRRRSVTSIEARQKSLVRLPRLPGPRPLLPACRPFGSLVGSVNTKVLFHALCDLSGAKNTHESHEQTRKRFSPLGSSDSISLIEIEPKTLDAVETQSSAPCCLRPDLRLATQSVGTSHS